MTAVAILNELIEAGASVRRQGDQVKIRGIDLIPAELLARARAEKAVILAALPDTAEIARQRSRLLTAARELGIPRLVIAELPDAEIVGCELLTDPGMRRFAQICLENWLTARGVLILHPTTPEIDLATYRSTHPDSPRPRGTTP